MNPRIARGKITSRCSDRDPLRALIRDQFDNSADAVAVALVTCEAQRDPVIRSGSLVMEDVYASAIGGEHGVDTAVVVDVADGQPAANPGIVEDIAGHARDVDEFSAVVTRQQHRFPVMELG